MKAKISLLFLIIVNLYGCDKSSENPAPDSDPQLGIISVSNTSVLEGEVVQINVGDTLLSNDIYEGLLGDKQVELMRETDSTLIFIVPIGLGQGSFDLNADLASNKLTFQISTILLPDTPDNIVKSIVDSSMVDLNDALTSGLLSTENYNAITNNLENYSSQFNNLSEDEKIEVATIIEANRKYLEELSEYNNTLRVQLDSIESQTGGRLAGEICSGEPLEVAECIFNDAVSTGKRIIENGKKILLAGSYLALFTSGTSKVIGVGLIAIYILPKLPPLAERTFKV